MCTRAKREKKGGRKSGWKRGLDAGSSPWLALLSVRVDAGPLKSFVQGTGLTWWSLSPWHRGWAMLSHSMEGIYGLAGLWGPCGCVWLWTKWAEQRCLCMHLKQLTKRNRGHSDIENIQSSRKGTFCYRWIGDASGPGNLMHTKQNGWKESQTNCRAAGPRGTWAAERPGFSGARPTLAIGIRLLKDLLL